jgi:hypothetical protein
MTMPRRAAAARASDRSGIFSPLNFAPAADSGQKGPQIGLKIGFGAPKKKTDTPMGNGCIKPIGNILGQFYFAS